MLNHNLITVVTASLKAAGITPPELTPLRPFPAPQASVEDLVEILLSSKHKDPYEDPKAIAMVGKLYIQSLGRLDQIHRQHELHRQAAELEAHKDTLLQQLQVAFNTTTQGLLEHSEPIKRVEDPATIAGNAGNLDAAIAAANTVQDLKALEAIVKAWRDLWTALGNISYGPDRGKSFMFMTPDARQWEQLRGNPTIWEAVRNGVSLTLADSPEQVSERYQAMINNEQAAVQARQDAKRPNYMPEGGYPQWVDA